MKQVVFAAAALAASAVFGGAALAQGMTDADLIEKFRAQMQSIRAATAGEDDGLGATRGLVLLAPPSEASGETGTVANPGAGLMLTPAGPGAGTEQAANDAGPAPTTVWNLPKSEQVNIQISFAFDSSALSASEKPKLQQICGVLDAAGVGTLRIVGHTDASGPWSYNQKLSELRAQEVMRFFVSDCSIPVERLQAVGVGEQFPYDDKNPRAGVNRRVEFQAIS